MGAGPVLLLAHSNPTNRALEEKVASLEGAEDCVVAASGMASVAATLFAHLEAGDHLLIGDEVFAITKVLWEEDLPRRQIDVTTVDMCDLAAVEAAIRPDTRMLFLETSTNPRLRMPDIAGGRGDRPPPRRLLVADNTFLGPALLRPLEHGADLVLHAATKYLSGHGDAVSGVVSGPKALIDPDPQADRHLRPGGEPLQQLPRPARRADAATPFHEGLGECRWASPGSWRRATRSSGSATPGSSPTRTMCWPPACSAAGTARC